MRSQELEHLIDSASASIYAEWPEYCSQARTGFTNKRRGTFFIDVDKPIPQPSETPYLTTHEVSHLLGLDGVSSVAISSRVGTYNPEQEIVVTLRSEKHSYARCVILSDPPDEYKHVVIVTEQPDPSVASTFDELLEILNDLYSRADSSVEGMDTRSRNVWVVMQAKWQIQCNGFYGYLSNVGPESCDMLTSLKDIESSILRDVFAPVFALFPDGEPSADCNVFDSQLDAITDEDEEAFEGYDSAFFQIESQIPDILWGYWTSSRKEKA
ncbi:MAG: DUF4375 domain-containing protein [Planctomycetota bacterium]